MLTVFLPLTSSQWGNRQSGWMTHQGSGMRTELGFCDRIIYFPSQWAVSNHNVFLGLKDLFSGIFGHVCNKAGLVAIISIIITSHLCLPASLNLCSQLETVKRLSPPIVMATAALSESKTDYYELPSGFFFPSWYLESSMRFWFRNSHIWFQGQWPPFELRFSAHLDDNMFQSLREVAWSDSFEGIKNDSNKSR